MNDAGFTISSPSGVRADIRGHGDLVLEIRSTDPQKPVGEVRFRVGPGGIVMGTPAGTTQDPPDFVAKDGAYTLKMELLDRGSSVFISAYRMEGGRSIFADDLTVPVR